MGTATVRKFDASDTGTAKVQIEELNPGTADTVLTWNAGSDVVVVLWEPTGTYHA